MLRSLIVGSIIIIGLQLSAFGLESIDRRRPQFQNEFGYIVTPLPFILPGVGTGVGLLGGLNNVYETPVDLYLVYITGDVEGGIVGITDIPLVSKRLLLDITSVDFNKGQQNRYLTRGMDSEPDDYNIVELSDSRLQGGRLILTFMDRMLEFYTIGYKVSFKISAVRDNDGNLVNEVEDPEPIESTTWTYGSFLDYTDDRSDPKKGLRFQLDRTGSTPSDEDAVDYYVMNYSLTSYIPVLSYSTWVFNLFRSDAHVTRQGESDPEALKNDFGCYEPTVDQCDPEVQEVIQSQVDQNRYGSATSLGGRSRLRSYVGGRYSAAHAEFVGTELRWNLTSENTPFDIWIMRDLRTGIQMAFFYEIGSVADQRQELWEETRDSYGIGARLVTGSGFIYRFDLAYGDEGVATTLFIDYPWGAL